jgi:iron complex transport system substrate-binding protein
LLAVGAVLVASCGGDAEPETSSAASVGEESGAWVYVGADGVSSEILDTSRIVTLSGDLTEAVFELGMGDSVVATDVTTIYPPEAVALPVVGVGRFLTAEGVLAESPTLVLGDTQTSPLQAVEQIRSAGVPVVIFDVPTTFEELYAKAADIGEVLGVPDAGDVLGESLRSAVEDVVAAAAPLEPAPGVAFVYSRGPDVMLLFGEGMTTQPIIEAAGGRDVGAASGVSGTVSVTPEAIVAAAPDVIVITSEGLAALGGEEGLLAIPGFAETPAGRAGRILAYPEGDFLTFGPRIAESLATFIDDLRAEMNG